MQHMPVYQTTIQNVNGLSRDEIASVCPAVFAEHAHDSRSARYAFIPTSELLDAMREIDLVPTIVMGSRTRIEEKREYAKHLLRFRRECDLGDRKPEVHEIVLVNAHDGLGAYCLYSGIFRLVCENGMVIGDFDHQFRVRHYGNVVSEVVESTLQIAQQSEGIMETVTQMKETHFTKPERLLLAEAAIRTRYDIGEEVSSDNLLFRPDDFLQPRRREDRGDDAWTTHNVLQENLDKGGTRYWDTEKRKRRTSRGNAGIGSHVKFNQQLWMLTQKMMELKQA